MNDLQTTPDTQITTALEKARWFHEIGRHDLAEREVRAALALEPDSPALYAGLGWALELQGRRSEAERAARAALGRDPEAVCAMLLLARIAMDRGRHAEAERVLIGALRLDPENPHLYRLYGALMQKLGRLEEAERLLRRSLALDPEQPETHSALALVLAERREVRPDGSQDARGPRLDPGRGHSHALLGSTYLRTGHPFKARAHLREALRLHPEDPNLLKAFLAADRATRWTYLPNYFWGLFVSRIPGKQFVLWGAALLLFAFLKRLGMPKPLTAVLALTYLLLAVYTLAVEPLTSAWIRLRPPR